MKCVLLFPVVKKKKMKQSVVGEKSEHEPLPFGACRKRTASECEEGEGRPRKRRRTDLTTHLYSLSEVELAQHTVHARQTDVRLVITRLYIEQDTIKVSVLTISPRLHVDT